MATVLGKLPYQIIGIYFSISLITFCIYAFDKSAAKNNRWRIKENTLHLFGMVGGWPGAFYAQKKLRHKSKKSKFKNVFWITVVINLFVLCCFFAGNGSQLVKTVLMITLRIHLDDINLENGCLKVLPKSHALGILDHSAIRQYAHDHEEVVCIARAGSALIMRPHILHSSSKAITPTQCRVLHLEYSSFTLPSGVEWA